MKKCPYCAELIQDEAIKCRYCLSDLSGVPVAQAEPRTVPVQPAGQPEAISRATAPRAGEGAVRFSHSGFNYVLGYGPDFFGIWERARPGGPMERYPRTDQGWVQAWNRFHQLEPQAVEVTASGPGTTGSGTSASAPPSGAAPAGPAVDTTTPGPSAETVTPGPPAVAGPKIGEGAHRFSHSGVRYILGYGADFFGIWDRQSPGGPVMRFPRTDDGWTEAWNRFTAWEPRAVEVPQGGTAPDLKFSGGEFRSGSTRANWTMWLLGIVALLTVIQFGFQSAELGLLSRVHRGQVVTREEADASDTRIQAINVIAGTVTIGLVVSWLMWQHRAHANLRALGASDLKYTPGWAVGWWFVPFAFFVVPFLTMRELWKASDPDSGAVDWKLKPATPVLGLWWAGWLLRISVFPTLALSAAPGDHPPVAQLITRDRYFLAGDVITLVTAILAFLLVRWINARLETKRQRVSSWTRGFVTAATA